MGKEQVSIPFRLVNNQIYLSASLDGKRYDNIVFDTGATNVVSAAAAKICWDQNRRCSAGWRFWRECGRFGLARIAVTDVGSVELRDQVFTVIDLGSLSKAEGVEEDGLLGYEIARRGSGHDRLREEHIDRHETGRFSSLRESGEDPFQIQ
jgi:hypothetical protein